MERGRDNSAELGAVLSIIIVIVSIFGLVFGAWLASTGQK